MIFSVVAIFTVGTLTLNGFDSSNSGTYTCSPNGTFPTVPPGDTITLNAAGEYSYVCNYEK